MIEKFNMDLFRSSKKSGNSEESANSEEVFKPRHQLTPSIGPGFFSKDHIRIPLGQSGEPKGESCYFCGFKTSLLHWLEIRHTGAAGEDIGSESNNYSMKVASHSDENEGVYACALCCCTQRLSQVGLLNRAVMIYLPELSQADLNHLIRHSAMACLHGTASQKKAGTRIIQMLMERAKPIEKYWGTANALAFARALYGLSRYEYSLRHAAFKSVRVGLFPMIISSKQVASGFESDMETYIKELPMSLQDCRDKIFKPMQVRAADAQRNNNEVIL